MESSRMGCEYRYCFSVEDEIIPKYPWHQKLGRRYVFEIRTNFIVKGRFENIDDGGGGINDEKVIGSEVFSVGFFDSDLEDMGVFLGTRLRDYWMSDDEVGEFSRKAFYFADDQQKSGRKTIPIPIGVDIGVCSVQQEGEPISATLGRAIKPECLYPASLCPWIQISNYSGEGDAPNMYHMLVLRCDLPTARVVDDKEECVICLCRPIVGSQVTTLKCGHAFHYHCIAKWLASKDTCPTCRHRAHDVFVIKRRLGL